MAKTTAVAYFGSAEEKERFLTELRAEMAAQALDTGEWHCQWSVEDWASFARGFRPPLWMPEDLHNEFHYLFMGGGGRAPYELAFFEAIEPGADLTGALSRWRQSQGGGPVFFAILHSCPVRKVP